MLFRRTPHGWRVHESVLAAHADEATTQRTLAGPKLRYRHLVLIPTLVDVDKFGLYLRLQGEGNLRREAEKSS
jgi:hypothetical protein